MHLCLVSDIPKISRSLFLNTKVEFRVFSIASKIPPSLFPFVYGKLVNYYFTIMYICS